jgi:hypothetical protein
MADLLSSCRTLHTFPEREEPPGENLILDKGGSVSEMLIG